MSELGDNSTESNVLCILSVAVYYIVATAPPDLYKWSVAGMMYSWRLCLAGLSNVILSMLLDVRFTEMLFNTIIGQKSFLHVDRLSFGELIERSQYPVDQ